ncbi:hypothetical protein GMW39_00825 [Pectobacterium parmentieri]|uniref:hypothetical protein n=1 Tax=Pectobacterium parmentieri TaxID=1905730 RepID=UPI001373B5C3|nr:hypothetical protein [Pectobacterium parmentieri]QHQ14552.1 hypothetical protein GMW39_00825 [Pectobacterium parmentieri]
MMKINTDDYDTINAYAPDKLWYQRMGTMESVNAYTRASENIVRWFLHDMRLTHKTGHWESNRGGGEQ